MCQHGVVIASLLALAAAAEPPEIVVHAEHLELEEGRIVGEQVEVAVGDGVLTAGAMQASLQGQTTIVLEDVVLSPCPCEGRDPWSVKAASAEVIVDESVRFRRGWLRLFDVPIVPIPSASIPLRRRSGLLTPTVGFGPYGLLLAQPVYLTATDQGDVTLTPEIRTSSSARMLGEGRYALRGGEGLITGAFGRDWRVSSTRGAARWDHGHDHQGVFLASRGQVLGDPDYLHDYGDAFLARNLPFVESRALAGFGPLEFGTRAYQNGGLTDHEVASLSIRRGGVDGPIGLVHQVEVFTGWSTFGELPWGTQLAGGMVSGSTSVSRPTWIGPVRITPTAAISGLSDIDAATAERVLMARGLGEIDARLGLWREGARSYERLEPGVRVAVNPAVVDGVLDAALRLPPWVVAPGVSWRRTTKRGLTELRAAIPIDDRALGATLDARVDNGPWSGWAQVDSGRPAERVDHIGDVVDLATAGLGWRSDLLDLRASWIFADRVTLPQRAPDVRDLHQARWSAAVTPPFLTILRIDGGLAHSLDDGTIQQRGLGLAYTHPTDCLVVGARGSWDADRAFPEVALKADFRL